MMKEGDAIDVQWHVSDNNLQSQDKPGFPTVAQERTLHGEDSSRGVSL
jgi:hypothetical protein